MDTSLVQGRVYYMSNGAVTPANRKYSTTGHDYRINFNEKTVVQEAPSEVCTFYRRSFGPRFGHIEHKICNLPLGHVANSLLHSSASFAGWSNHEGQVLFCQG